ncbi:type II toxin-antitoxin system HicB family antitoxin [Desulfovibrio sp. TomC]|uniref:type II toxin-antitoxin system HicB family antitoxin n=1 Tax=Desulfovibrio sp. TomC TaxID=1562888 RepID=UPI000573E877|nr:type II toxin-antitoxin system HicB family antitoxin [Desulfovibrio sp. TomC]KHK02565.1 HicB protein [Desulfovibrio sp. TomC]
MKSEFTPFWRAPESCHEDHEIQGLRRRIQYDAEGRGFHGRVVNIRDTVTFEGASVPEREQALADSVEDSLEFCSERGREPDKPFSGKCNIRLTPQNHRLVATAAKAAGLPVASKNLVASAARPPNFHGKIPPIRYAAQ